MASCTQVQVLIGSCSRATCVLKTAGYTQPGIHKQSHNTAAHIDSSTMR